MKERDWEGIVSQPLPASEAQLFCDLLMVHGTGSLEVIFKPHRSLHRELSLGDIDVASRPKLPRILESEGAK